jgi:hypothetical protein
MVPSGAAFLSLLAFKLLRKERLSHNRRSSGSRPRRFAPCFAMFPKYRNNLQDAEVAS